MEAGNRALIIGSDEGTRSELFGILLAAGSFAEVEQVSSPIEALVQLVGGEALDMIFMVDEFEPAELAILLEEGRNTDVGRQCAFILVCLNRRRG